MRKEVAAAVVAVLLITAGVAGANGRIVVKCVAADGAVSYRSGQCDAGQQPARSWSPTPAPGPTAAETRARARQRAADADYLRKLAARYRGGAGHRRDSKPDPCALARRARADARRDAHLDYEARDRLDDAVMRACY